MAIVFATDDDVADQEDEEPEELSPVLQRLVVAASLGSLLMGLDTGAFVLTYDVKISKLMTRYRDHRRYLGRDQGRSDGLRRGGSRMYTSSAHDRGGGAHCDRYDDWGVGRQRGRWMAE